MRYGKANIVKDEYQYSYDVDHEHIVIPISNTVVHPWTVVIVSVDALVSKFAVSYPSGNDDFSRRTDFINNSCLY
jgi:hypothetical protein